MCVLVHTVQSTHWFRCRTEFRSADIFQYIPSLLFFRLSAESCYFSLSLCIIRSSFGTLVLYPMIGGPFSHKHKLKRARTHTHTRKLVFKWTQNEFSRVYFDPKRIAICNRMDKHSVHNVHTIAYTLTYTYTHSQRTQCALERREYSRRTTLISFV